MIAKTSKKNKDVKRKDKLKERHVYYVSLWRDKEDFDTFISCNVVIEVIGWYYKSNSAYHYFYSMCNKDSDDIGMETANIAKSCFSFAVPKKAVIEIIELGKTRR